MVKPTHCVALALVRRGTRWLVARRPSALHVGGVWEFPGGKQRPGESAAQAALRELCEECGVRAEVERVEATVEWEYDDRRVQLTPVVCRWIAGHARPLGNAGCYWVTRARLRELPMPPANAIIVARVLGAA